jgi:Family of unknown function (DUF6011)
VTVATTQHTPLVTEAGVYETPSGDIFVVKPNREGTRLYAKRLVEINAQRATEAGERVEIEFQYESGAIYGLKPEMKMDLERAKALTIRYGRCIVCGRRLKAAESVERGIGPVCIKSFRVPEKSVTDDILDPSLPDAEYHARYQRLQAKPSLVELAARIEAVPQPVEYIEDDDGLDGNGAPTTRQIPIPAAHEQQIDVDARRARKLINDAFDVQDFETDACPEDRAFVMSVLDRLLAGYER